MRLELQHYYCFTASRNTGQKSKIMHHRRGLDLLFILILILRLKLIKHNMKPRFECMHY